MTKEEQNIAIAYECGWHIDDKDGNWKDSTGKYGLNGCPPRFTEDLNACHEMEKLIQPSKDNVNSWRAYIEKLDWIFYTKERGNSPPPIYFEAIHATAAQRCEAFLRVKGLWKEETK